MATLAARTQIIQLQKIVSGADRKQVFTKAVAAPSSKRVHTSSFTRNKPQQVTLRRPMQVTAAAKKGGPPEGPYVATNRYMCMDDDAVTSLKAEWERRRAAMEVLPGFTEFVLKKGDKPGEWVATQTWESRETYEEWMETPLRRQSHFFGEIYQFNTENKWSVPEDYMPIYMEQ
mmetsp:Transcript_14071/g.17058  ORF Transcript_14071/g.17058 Transcript_14071/m.17058 type:complete len:174 (-) Transcript_14071:244-765(-)|eukprot:CAMPEP_0197852238 /NCGR_PEP_ID=MMETSP1438-20131217/20006_1 /TAXON_ID=1461541 /ORGANISM="Pterosperma sp., Strain CCMP1384" /LENGTH=173 /DNA_ID=CAMNT_0043466171 /DNA_START=71 /DNA_END=592 /DNA_ORIENTATION=+